MASREIKDLYPSFQPLVTKFLDETNKLTTPWKTFITDGFRSFEEQTELYAQGRTKAGKTVTNAKAGESWHNFGLAIDVAFQKDGKLSYDQKLYNKIVNIGKELGFVWGGEFTGLVDKPHFEWHPNLTLAQARVGLRPLGGIISSEMSQPWLRQMFIETGLDIDKPEGEIRGRVQEVIDGFKKYGELQDQIVKLQKDVAFQTGEAAKHEQEAIQFSQTLKDVQGEVISLRRALAQRDTDISNLQTQLGDLQDKLDPEKIVPVPVEEYKKLISKNGLNAYTRKDLFGALIKSLFRKG